MKSSLADVELSRQRKSNTNAAQFSAVFAPHREHLTALVRAAGVAQQGAGLPSLPRLCVLGAGNCGDLELARLAEVFGEIHLVDLDEQALARARAAQGEAVRARLVEHPGLDLSGLLARLERWRDRQVQAQELIEHAHVVSSALAERLGSFDVVLSACVLSQMQLAVRLALGEHHPLFNAAGLTLTVTHLWTLARLTRPGGRALLASDVASEEIAPLATLSPDTDLERLLAELIAAGDVFHSVSPATIASVRDDDPGLCAALGGGRCLDVWLWHNGPKRIFLVYALELLRL